MSIKRVVLQPAFVLYTRPYRDTSLLVELLTRQSGRLTVLARGVRSMRSRAYGLLRLFSPLLVSFSGKSDLQNLNQVESNGNSYNLSANALFSGFYVNELLLRLLQRYDPHPNIYKTYQQTLITLAKFQQSENALRVFEKKLLVDLGYGLQLDRTVNGDPVLPEKNYTFEFGVGLQKTKTAGQHSFSGGSLLALQMDNLASEEELRDAKKLLHAALRVLLGGRPLKTQTFFNYF